MVRYRLLGKSGLRVSEAAPGTMTFGDDWGTRWGSRLKRAVAQLDFTQKATKGTKTDLLNRRPLT
jgi:aryl-alcohol dehydrogenase-like predicted oxidoreductase